MSFVWPSTASLVAFLFIVSAVVVLGVAGVWAGSRSEGDEVARRRALWFGLGWVGWCAVLGVVVGSGVIRTDIRLAMPLLLASNVAAVAVALSSVGRWLARLPATWLVAFHGFRLPLEVVLHRWGEQGSIPMTMTWSGSNLDVVTGVTALALAPFAHHRPVAWTANLLGFALLINVARVAVFSLPLPFAWGQDPPLLLAAYVPVYLIVPVCVAGALAGHLVLFRKLLAARE